jgi:hypothetical protein
MKDLLDLYCLAYEYEVRDLMWRCEEEIVLKLSPSTVVCILVNYYTRLANHIALPSTIEPTETSSVKAISPRSPLSEEHKLEQLIPPTIVEIP